MKKGTILIVATSGGHLSEALILLENVIRKAKRSVLYVNYTNRKLDMFGKVYIEKKEKTALSYIIDVVLTSIKILYREKPEWIITTGAEIALPVCILGKLMGSKVIFIETVTRFTTATKTGKLLYFFCDRFYVQNKETLKCYGKKAEYVGGLL